MAACYARVPFVTTSDMRGSVLKRRRIAGGDKGNQRLAAVGFELSKGLGDAAHGSVFQKVI